MRRSLAPPDYPRSRNSITPPAAARRAELFALTGKFSMQTANGWIMPKTAPRKRSGPANGRHGTAHAPDGPFYRIPECRFRTAAGRVKRSNPFSRNRSFPTEPVSAQWTATSMFPSVSPMCTLAGSRFMPARHFHFRPLSQSHGLPGRQRERSSPTRAATRDLGMVLPGFSPQR